MVASGNRDEILNLMTRIARIQIYIIGLICVGFICIGRDFIQLWLGNGYDEVYVCALLIILPSFLQLPQEIGNTTVIAEGKVKLQAYAFMLMAAINLVLSYPMTKYYGVVGLCGSIMIAYIVRTIMMDYIYYKTLHINIIIFFTNSYIKILPSLLFITAICLLFNRYYIIQTGWIGFIIKTIAYTSCYLFSIWFLAMNKSEKELFSVPIKKILKIR